jgi:predicted glycoside hydrolase/deacetylase ChbG (UPF0249 family)
MKNAPDPPRLIINADDFGLSHGISDGIAAAHRCGILTSTSVMVKQPASEYALELLRGMPNLGVGIHLNLCTGCPVLSPREVPTLVAANGNFHAPEVLFRRLWRFQLSGSEIEAEFRAQISWLKDRGVVPIHADSHLHAHIYPAAVGPFRRALRHEGIRCARAPRCSVWPPTGRAGGPHEGSLARRLLVHGYRTALQFGPLRTLTTPHSRVSFHVNDRRDLASIGRCWIAALNNLPAGTFELACHPGLRQPGFSESDRIADQREQELRWLTSSALREALANNHIESIRYADLRGEADESSAIVEAQAS